MKRLLSIVAVSAAAALTLAGCSGAATPTDDGSSSATTWPEAGRSVNLIIGFAAGGSTDTFARIIADELSKETGARVEVVNQAGAGTQLAHQAMLAAPQDGYTMSMVNLPSLLNYIYTGDKAPFTRADFSPIAAIGASPNGLIVKADSPYKTMDDLIEAAKKSDTPINAGWNNATDDAIVLAGMEEATGKPFNRVVYDGTSEKIQALLAGDIQFFSGAAGGVVPQIQSGDLRMLAQWGSERSTLLPDVPTAKELGYNVEFTGYLGLTFGAKVPKDIRDAAEAAIKTLSQDKEFIERSNAASNEVAFLSGTDFNKVWADQEDFITKISAQIHK